MHAFIAASLLPAALDRRRSNFEMLDHDDLATASAYLHLLHSASGRRGVEQAA
jgi:hypothetical protein